MIKDCTHESSKWYTDVKGVKQCLDCEDETYTRKLQQWIKNLENSGWTYNGNGILAHPDYADEGL